MAKNVRLNLTNDEKLAQNLIGLDKEHVNFNMSEGNIDDIIKKEKSYKFNEELNKVADKLESNRKLLEENAQNLGDDISNVEIKPMFNRLLFKPFAQNPFQRIKVENGIIIDAGTLTPKADYNPNTGKYEEMKEWIKTGVVQEVGPEVKYIRPGDVIYFRVDTSVPVPFLKQGLSSICETQVIAVVNEGLEERFKNI
jgi:hypothetical protein